ncbi:MAG: amidase family protein [Candidatus Bathyarchaeota archaeon]|nr:amidase family protein [Candidatus Bathyarchaeota archaeon]
MSPKKPMSESLVYASASTAARAIYLGEVTSYELMKTILRRVETYNPKLNAIVTLLGKEALAAAKRADEAMKRGENLGPLHGVPVTVKDCFEMKGVRTTAGSKSLADYIPQRDSAPVERLRAAGAVIIGHTNTPEMAADWQTYNAVFGTTNNPWDTKLTPGGSTGGGAAALASGLTFLEVGSDIGGSIRIPSHFCGLYGHKPSIGAVSARGHIPPAPGSPVGEPAFSVAGPMARSADDLRLAMDILGGSDGEAAKAFTWSLPPPRKAKLSDYRIGYVIDDQTCRVSSEVKAPLAKMVVALKEEGLEVVEGWPGGVDPKRLFEDYRYIRYASGAGSLSGAQIYELLKEQIVNDGSDEYAAAHAYASSVKEFQDTLWRRAQAQEAWREYFQHIDAFLIPPAFVPAFPHDHRTPLKSRVLHTPEGARRYQELRFWISFATLCGLPATVAPVGSTPNGLPVGVQILGPYLEDATTIDVAGKMARVIGGFRAPPGYD